MTPHTDAEFSELEQTVAELTRERDAALAQRSNENDERIAHQAATIEVLKAMSASPGDAEPVFDLMCRQAKVLLHVPSVSLFEYDGRLVHLRANPDIEQVADPATYAAYANAFPMVPDRGSLTCRAILDGTIIHIRDLAIEPGISQSVRDLGHRTQVTVPMLRAGRAIGAITTGSMGVDGISDSQIELLKTFAEQAVIAIASAETYRALQSRTADLQQSLEYQTATSDVLKVISRSTFDLQPVLGTVAETAARLCDAGQAVIWRRADEVWRLAANFGFPAEFEAFHRARAAFSLDPQDPSVSTRAALEGRIVHVHDAAAIPGYPEILLRLGKHRTTLGVPLTREGEAIGVIMLARQRVEPFTDRQIDLVSTFADQAVIAIENARLLTEQQEALEQQTATAEVLQVINASPGDLTPVFDAILEKAHTLCGATIGSLMTYDGELVRAVATHGFPEEHAALIRRGIPLPAPIRQMAADGRPFQVPDTKASQVPVASESGRFLVERTDIRTFLAVPLLNDGAFLGYISAYRTEVRPFADKEIALLENFAAQAVIAMENARLLGELRERTAELAERNEAFAERIDHQAATIDVLKAMSASPGDARPALELIARRAWTLCNGLGAVVYSVDGPMMDLVVYHRPDWTEEQHRFFRGLWPRSHDGLMQAPAIRERRIHQIPDINLWPGVTEYARSVAKSFIWVPLMRNGMVIGLIGIDGMETGGFSDTQIELLKTFAEQAVIAIGSAETYRALQERTAALAQRNSEFGERIQQQSATIDVLKVMSSTPDDAQPVFDQIVTRARELCNCFGAGLYVYDGELVHLGALTRHEVESVDTKFRELFPRPLTREMASFRAMLDGQTVHICDIDADPDINPAARGTIKSSLAVPMVRDGIVIGCVSINSKEKGGFTDSQIALLRTFAEQAVIAITSVANFRALRERTAELTRSVAELQALEEVTRAVNSSLDVDTVLETIISRAVTLSQADEGTIYEYDDAEEVFVLKATHGMTETRVTRLREARIKLGDTYLGHAGLLREPVHVSDLQFDPTLPDSTKEALHDIHAVLALPLLREDKVLGGLVIRRRTTGDFPTTIPTLLQTFAAQSVLAIENARLFQDARRARLSAEATLTDLRRTQDRLVQTEKMASLGQLTAGIAHEIKNPLNFVNNFSDLSVDLLNELNEAVGPDKLNVADDLRAEIDEITATLKGNLERIAQHGRRADSIVKNMLLHSRTGPSEHREIDLNATVEEALNLAYHGARAETPGFNITLEKHFDPAAGVIDAFPQEFTRVMLNLMSNGFYAARKRAATAPNGFEPTLTITTANLGDSVTIGVRDNGTGMPDSVRDKIFEPFFTTKPAGEGTGLGLSLSFDIVVKQHGGQLTVASEVDKFTEFTVTLPRRVAQGATP